MVDANGTLALNLFARLNTQNNLRVHTHKHTPLLLIPTTYTLPYEKCNITLNKGGKKRVISDKMRSLVVHTNMHFQMRMKRDV